MKSRIDHSSRANVTLPWWAALVLAGLLLAVLGAVSGSAHAEELPLSGVPAAEGIISAMGDYSCGLRSDGTLACWGDDQVGKMKPPGGNYRQVSLGGSFVCGIQDDGTLACRGYNDWGQADPQRARSSRSTPAVPGPAAFGTTALWPAGAEMTLAQQIRPRAPSAR